MKCKKCGQDMLMVEYYNVGLPEGVGYDGVSEYSCQDCKLRIGRWSGLDLKDNEMERRFGGEPVKV